MSGPFATYFGNQRTSEIPLAPQKCTSATFTGAATTVCDVVTLTAANVANGSIIAYVHFLALYVNQVAGAAAGACQWQWQFRTAAHANVGAAVNVIPQVTAGNNAAAAAAVLSHFIFNPVRPWNQSLTIPATAAEIVLQRVTVVNGVPSIVAIEQWGIDPLNTGTPGDIGGGGIVAQGANSPNAF